MLGRRGFMIGIGGAAVVAGAALPFRATGAEPSAFGGQAFAGSIAAIEAQVGGRLGIAVLDTGSGARFARRGDERFPLCSTFKLLLAAATLRRVERGQERLDRRIPVTEADLINHAPVAEQHVGGELSVEALCEAAMIHSDNTAANLLLPPLGGPAGLTRYLRSIGDPVSRLDRDEPALGEATPGDPRDTTSPIAIVGTMERLLVGSALTPVSRAMLIGWLVDNRTGGKRLRAGVPAGWRVGDKTGTGGHGTVNDVAILWPPRRAPILVTAYLTETDAGAERSNAAHAAVARAIARAVA